MWIDDHFWPPVGETEVDKHDGKTYVRLYGCWNSLDHVKKIHAELLAEERKRRDAKNARRIAAGKRPFTERYFDWNNFIYMKYRDEYLEYGCRYECPFPVWKAQRSWEDRERHRREFKEAIDKGGPYQPCLPGLGY